MSLTRQINLDDHITDNFTWREMLKSSAALRLGISNLPDNDEICDNIRRVCTALEAVRAHFGRPLIITSCYRSVHVNAAVGGSLKSAHMKGLAADFTVPDVPNIEVCRVVAKIYLPYLYDQIIYEFGPEGWVHLGLADKPRAQTLTAKKVNGETVYSRGFVE